MDILKGSWSKLEQKKGWWLMDKKQDKYLNPSGTVYKTISIFKMSYKIGEVAIVSMQKGPSATRQPKPTQAKSIHECLCLNAPHHTDDQCISCSLVAGFFSTLTSCK